MLEFPVIRLTLGTMKQSILHAFSTQQAGLEQAIDAAIENFDVQAEIARQTDAVLREAIRDMVCRTVTSVSKRLLTLPVEAEDDNE